MFTFAYQFLVLYLVCNVLLLCRGMTFGVNQSGVSDEVPSVLHNEAPTNAQTKMFTAKTSDTATVKSLRIGDRIYVNLHQS